MGVLAWAWGGQLYAWAVEQVVGRIGWYDGEDALLQGGGPCPVGKVSSAIWQFGVGLGQRWWGLVGVRLQGEVASIGTGHPGVVAYASAD